MFKIGDKVKIIDDTAEGKITKIISSHYVEVEIDGFILIKKVSEIVLNTFNENHLQNFTLLIKDEQNFKNSKKNSQEQLAVNIVFDKKLKSDVLEIDLHFHNIVNNESNIQPWDRLSYQLDFLKKWLDIAKQKKYKKIIIIHGIGSGVLKQEVLKLLSNYPKVYYYDGSYKKYGQGATEVRFL